MYLCRIIQITREESNQNGDMEWMRRLTRFNQKPVPVIPLPLGMKQHFYHDMPHHVERNIKNALISHYGRTGYYHYHSAHRPISPDVLQVIESVCQRYNWTQPLRFDAEVEDYVW